MQLLAVRNKDTLDQILELFPELKPVSDLTLTTEEAAPLLGVSPKTLRNWRHLHRGPRYKREGSTIRYRLQDIESYLARTEGGAA